MLVDEVIITVKGGKGGDGVVSFFPMKRGPDGGTGGNGGNIYFIINPQLSSLHKYSEKKVWQANDGKPGESYRKTGANGEDMILQMPKGTFITDESTNIIVELTEHNSPLLVARGGKGGLGNDAFKTAVHQTPRKSEKGHPGEERILKIEMKYIADYGLIGLPNAGKSSLLNELTSAQAKIANYPFTTLEPNLGVLHGKVIADIPGLIEGAAKGKGLGTRFLKHIERVSLLLHCIALDSGDVLADYQIVRNELEQYNPQLAVKKEIILLTKSDLVDKKVVQATKKKLASLKKEILVLSIHDWDAVEKLKKILL